MSLTSTANSRDGANGRVEADDNPQAVRRSSTHSAVKGEVSPRLPHERDESSDSGIRPPDPLIEQAQKDVENGLENTDRSEATDDVYNRTLRGHTVLRK
jgi:hypothetical protein